MHDRNQFGMFIGLTAAIFPAREFRIMNTTDEPFAIFILDPDCPECCCNECGEEFTWDGGNRPLCPSCSSKSIRSV